MKLYGVKNTSSYPPQCVTVSDSKERAEQLAGFLAAKLPDATFETFETSEFWPRGMVEPDQAIIRAYDEFFALNSFQTRAITDLARVGITAEPLANWITCETPDGAVHTIMSKYGVADLVAEHAAPQCPE